VPLILQHAQRAATACFWSPPTGSHCCRRPELAISHSGRGIDSPARRDRAEGSAAKIAELEAGFEKAANAPATRKFLDDAGEQLLIRKGPAFRQYIDTEYEAVGRLAKALNLSPQ
jgi:hypothetical protein